MSEPVLLRLKKETYSEHKAIEEALGLASSQFDLPSYDKLLACFYGFYTPLEMALEPWGESTLPDFEARRKATHLGADLTARGMTPTDVSYCTELPEVMSAAQAFGCLYVLEGQTLGAQILCRHFHRTLGMTPANGGRFFQAYGEETAAQWRGFGAALTAFANTESLQSIVIASANSTFQTLRNWCDGKIHVHESP